MKLIEVDLKTLLEIVKAKVKGETQQDDKTMIMERTIQLVANLSDHSKVQESLTNSFISQLWNSIDHPPMLYMGDKFRFRQPDGSNNVSLHSVLLPPMLSVIGTDDLEPVSSSIGRRESPLL